MLQLFKDFFHSEKAGGLLLVFCTVISLLVTNSSFGESYLHFWHISVGGKQLEFWINDGLMTIFFLLVGLEIERELYIGELSGVKKALLPVLAAAGGMIVPAAIHFSLNRGTSYENGFGIPMATDIAFSLGILSLLGKRVPVSLKVFLTALAIIDDLGAILVIVLFYSKNFTVLYLVYAGLLFAFMLVLNRLKIYKLWLYLLLGCILWFCLYRSGIHPTITGVLLAFAIPFQKADASSPSYRLQHYLHNPVAFFVLPVFALANTAIILPVSFIRDLASANSYGIIFGLVIGKPLGIFLFSFIGIALGWCVVPAELRKRDLVGAGFLAGIGFTMSIFITLLAFTDAAAVSSSKIAVLVASLLSGVIGFIWLRIVRRHNKLLPLLGAKRL